MCIDDCVAAIRAVEMLVFLWTLSCSNDTSGFQLTSRMLPGHSWYTRDLCRLPYVAAASG